jgi:predicted membrane-bound dolichyl-phosphate-mannose-protein mannosyltransferase
MEHVIPAGTHKTKTGASVEVVVRKIPEAISAMEYKIKDSHHRTKYYHEKHPTLKKDFQSLLDGATFDSLDRV